MIRDRLRYLAAPASVGGLATAVAWVRLGGTARGTMWAEDGRIFLPDALHHGVGTWFHPYGGYLQLLPRMISSAVVAIASPEGYAVAVTLASCVVAGVCAAIVAYCSRDVVGQPWARWSIAALTVLTPALPIEVLGNLANLHSLLLWSAVWVLLHQPRSRTTAWAWAAWLAVVALSEVQIILLLPLALWHWRELRCRPLAAVVLGGALIELILSLASTRRAPLDPTPSPGSMIAGLLSQVTSLRGVVPTAAGHAGIGFVLGVALCVVIVAAAILVVRRTGRHPPRTAVAALGALALATWFIPVLVNHSVTGFPHGPALTEFRRYAVLPQMCLLAVVIIAASHVQRTWLRRTAGVTLTVALLAGAYAVGPHDTRRGHGPTWHRGITAARTACAHALDNTPIKIPQAPRDSAGQWHAPLRCGDLR